MNIGLEDRRLFGRINRRLNRLGEQLHKTNHWELGPYYVTDVGTNTLVASGISDLAGFLDDLNQENAN